MSHWLRRIQIIFVTHKGEGNYIRSVDIVVFEPSLYPTLSALEQSVIDGP